jgi:hypothetical protein
MTLYVSAYSLRELETKYPKLTYEPLLSLKGVGQLDECLHCWAATGTDAACHIFKVGTLFQVKYDSLGDGLRWWHFRGV